MVGECHCKAKTVNKSGYTAASLALISEQEAICNYLARNGYEPDPKLKKNASSPSMSKLTRIISEGNVDKLKNALKKSSLHSKFTDALGETLLHKACKNGKTEIVRYLVMECGYDVNLKNTNGQTPFHAACIEGYISVVSILVQQRHDTELSQYVHSGRPNEVQCYRLYLLYLVNLVDLNTSIWLQTSDH